MKKINCKTLHCNKDICTILNVESHPAVIISNNKTTNQFSVMQLTSQQSKNKNRPSITTYAISSLHSITSYMNFPFKFIDNTHKLSSKFKSKKLNDFICVEFEDVLNYFFTLPKHEQIYFVARPFKEGRDWIEAFEFGASQSPLIGKNKGHISNLKNIIAEDMINILENINDQDYLFMC